jgi:hypothetical protein
MTVICPFPLSSHPAVHSQQRPLWPFLTHWLLPGELIVDEIRR